MNRLFVTAAAVALVAAAGPALARDQIRVVGSSTVFPYSQAVAERFSSVTGRPAPVVEGTGTGGGMQIFCQGIGEQHPDFTGASRAMRPSEWELCKQNGVTDVSEVLLGYDGLSMAVSQNGQDMSVTKAQLFQALAAEVVVDGEIKPNPFRRWSEIDPSLPDIPITVYGPPPTSGTRDAWVELVMHSGCAEFSEIKALEKARNAEVCERMRTDGPFIEAGENDNLIVQRLQSDPNAFGIFGFSFLFENQDSLKGVEVNGVMPSEETVASGEYPVSRPLFMYIKNAHRGVIPGMQEFVEELVSEDAMGAGGYLEERGLIPLSEERFAEVSKTALDGVSMEAPST